MTLRRDILEKHRRKSAGNSPPKGMFRNEATADASGDIKLPGAAKQSAGKHGSEANTP
jgi:hypothetical protein